MAEKDQVKDQASAETVQESKGLLDQIIEDGRMARDETQKARARDLIGEFVAQITQGAMAVSKNTEAMINARISQIDKLISDQLNVIMHHQDFQKLEGSWRGVFYLVNQSETGERLKIRVMNATKQELLKDMEKAPEFDQSTLFKKIYEEEFGMFGGASYGAIVGDYEFGNNPQDLTLLEKVSQVAAAAHAPFLTAARPDPFQPRRFHRPGDPPRPGEDLPERGIREVEIVQGQRGFPLRSLDPAARPHASPLRQGQQPGRDF